MFGYGFGSKWWCFPFLQHEDATSGFLTLSIKCRKVSCPWLKVKLFPFVCRNAMFLTEYKIDLSVKQQVLVLAEVADVC